jgi:hypothetical protein
MRRQAIVDAVHATADALSASIDHMKVVEDFRREYASNARIDRSASRPERKTPAIPTAATVARRVLLRRRREPTK